MKIYTEQPLSDFYFWSGASSNAEQLTPEELDRFECMLEDLYPDGLEDVQINDIFWYDFEWVCKCLGLELDEAGDIIRDEE